MSLKMRAPLSHGDPNEPQRRAASGWSIFRALRIGTTSTFDTLLNVATTACTRRFNGGGWR